MKIVVCVKQVPDTWAEKKLNPTDQTLDRRLRTVFWIIFAGLTAATGYTVFEAISPTGILSLRCATAG